MLAWVTRVAWNSCRGCFNTVDFNRSRMCWTVHRYRPVSLCVCQSVYMPLQGIWGQGKYLKVREFLLFKYYTLFGRWVGVKGRSAYQIPDKRLAPKSKSFCLYIYIVLFSIDANILEYSTLKYNVCRTAATVATNKK